MMFALSSPIAKRIGYLSSYDCLSQLRDVQSIDYFFACNALSRRYDHQESHSFFTDNVSLQQIFHILVALSYSQRQGHGCLDLRAICDQLLWLETEQVDEPAKHTKQKQGLKAGFQFIALAELDNIVKAFLDINPERDDLHWARPYLYTARYWQYEKEIADYFITQQKQKISSAEASFTGLQHCADRLWPQLFNTTYKEGDDQSGDDQADVDWQLLSVVNGLLSKTSIISGGAGTGKTYTVARLLLSWLFMQKDNASNRSDDKTQGASEFSHKRPKLLLAAPTGKAAQRLNSSILEEFSKLKSNPDLADLVDELSPMIEARTLHRLLGLGMFGIQPRYNEKQTLDCDFLVVDEASMIDVAMMAKLLRALPKRAKLILVGDANQLPSVESGGLLKDLVNQTSWLKANIEQVYTQAHLKTLRHLLPSLGVQEKGESAPQTGPSKDGNAPSNIDVDKQDYQYDHVTFLQKSMRSRGKIKTLADTILFGDQSSLQDFLLENVSPSEVQDEQQASPAESTKILNTPAVDQTQLSFDLIASNPEDEIVWFQSAFTAAGSLKPELMQRIAQKYHAVFNSGSASQALSKLQHYRLLSPTKKGRLGTEALNIDIEKQLRKQFSHIQLGNVYKGMPIMVVQNDYRLGLFNGDIGVVWTNKSGQLAACFATSIETNEVKEYSLMVLPKFELVYAMTIHKTQGSEFADVDIVLPSQGLKTSNVFESQHVSKELLYTGVTRAKRSIGLITNLQSIKDATANSSKRYSGLKRQMTQPLTQPNTQPITQLREHSHDRPHD